MSAHHEDKDIRYQDLNDEQAVYLLQFEPPLINNTWSILVLKLFR